MRWIVGRAALLGLLVSGCSGSVPLPPLPSANELVPAPRPLRPEREQRAQMLRVLSVYTGPDADDCGSFPMRHQDPDPPTRHARLERALTCLHAHAVAAQPVRMTVRVRATDTWTVLGLLAVGDGTIYNFSYSASPLDPRDLELRVLPCPRPRVDVDPERIYEFDCFERNGG